MGDEPPGERVQTRTPPREELYNFNIDNAESYG